MVSSETHRRCSTCHTLKPLMEFYRRNEKRYGVDARRTDCVQCVGDSSKKRYRSPEQYAKILERNKTYRRTHNEELKTYARARSRMLRERVLEKYGNACACCGEVESRFLTIDHVNNDGHAERALFANNSVSLIYKLHKMPRSAHYRLLCFNCNCGRALNGNVCPHDDELKRLLTA